MAKQSTQRPRKSSGGYAPEETRQALIDSALALFGEKGYAVTSVQEITEAAGVTKRAFYHHFGSKEELLALIHDEFRDEEEALQLANDTAYGLAAGIWTADLRRAHRMAHGIRAGTVWINSYRAVAPMVPFGGFKASGIGRENGLESLHEYTESKSVWVELSGASRDPFKLG